MQLQQKSERNCFYLAQFNNNVINIFLAYYVRMCLTYTEMSSRSYHSMGSPFIEAVNSDIQIGFEHSLQCVRQIEVYYVLF